MKHITLWAVLALLLPACRQVILSPGCEDGDCPQGKHAAVVLQSGADTYTFDRSSLMNNSIVFQPVYDSLFTHIRYYNLLAYTSLAYNGTVKYISIQLLTDHLETGTYQISGGGLVYQGSRPVVGATNLELIISDISGDGFYSGSISGTIAYANTGETGGIMGNFSGLTIGSPSN